MSSSDISNCSFEDWKEECSGCEEKDDMSIKDCAEILLMLSKINQNQPEKYKNRKISSDIHIVKYCQLCNKSQTPLWRRTNEYHTLCNACGIRERNHKKIKPSYI